MLFTATALVLPLGLLPHGDRTETVRAEETAAENTTVRPIAPPVVGAALITGPMLPVIGPPVGSLPRIDCDDRVIPLPRVEETTVLPTGAAPTPAILMPPAREEILPPRSDQPQSAFGMEPTYARQFDEFLKQAAAAEPLEEDAQEADARMRQLKKPKTAPVVAMEGPTDEVAAATSGRDGEMTDDDYLREVRPDLVRPRYLRSPSQLTPPGIPLEPPTEPYDLLMLPMDAPLGYTGPSSVVPREGQTSSHFVPIEDRWRIGLPEWDRYGLNHPPLDDYPYTLGRMLDPYHQNVLKGDYPIIGQHTFLDVTAESISDFEGRQVPTPAHPFESTHNPNENDFFGNPNQFFTTDFFALSLDLFHGDAAFRPVDWRVKVTPVFDMNYLDVQELGIVSPNVDDGTTRFRTWTTLEEWFAEAKLADTSSDYDFTSIRVGSQPFLSDFRGFIYEDVNRAVRLFGTQDANQIQFNFYYVDWLEKETNSGLNTFDNRPKHTFITNFYWQDFIFPGYTTQFNFLYDYDRANTEYDNNGFLVRPDPAGVAFPHTVTSYYLGWTGEGHINRINISHAFYWVLGNDSLNPIAGRPIDIDAQMAAVELSYDRDWARFRTSFFYASGDSNPFGNKGTGFDTILDDPNFAGGPFSYWDRQQIKLLGVNLVQGFSLVPDLRSSKIQGQPNFVNPGLYLGNLGADFDITPKLRLVGNVNWLWFAQTEVLEEFLFQAAIPRFIGTDLGLGFEYRPHLNNNIIVMAGVQGLVPGDGFRAIYDPIVGNVGGLFAGFMNLALKF